MPRILCPQRSTQTRTRSERWIQFAIAAVLITVLGGGLAGCGRERPAEVAAAEAEPARLTPSEPSDPVEPATRPRAQAGDLGDAPVDPVSVGPGQAKPGQAKPALVEPTQMDPTQVDPGPASRAADPLADERDRLRRQQEALDAERARLAERRAILVERERRLEALEGDANVQTAAPDSATEPRIDLEAGAATADEVEPDEVAPGDPDSSADADPDLPTHEGAPQDAPAPLEPTSPEPAVAHSEFDPEIDSEDLPPASEAAVRSLEPGRLLEIEILDTLSSRTHRVGDTFDARLVQELRAEDGTLLVPAGAPVVGEVTHVVPLKRVGGRAELDVAFTQLVLATGEPVSIRATFVAQGKDKRRDKRKIAGAAIVGAILGRILGDGAEGAVKGAAAGAAAGTAVVARAKGKDAVLPAGETVAIQLEEVVTVAVEYSGPADPE